jgi:MFS family permease
VSDPANGDASTNATAAFRYPDFRLLQIARVLAVVAFQMQGVAVGWRVYEVTGRALDLGLVGLAQFVPMFAFALLTGHVADRFDRRRVVAVCHASLAVAAAAIAWAAGAEAPSVTALYLILFVVGTARAFAAPATQALLPNLVPQRVFANAVAWNAGIFHVAIVLGPALGGLLYGPLGARGLFCVCAVGELLAFGLLLGIKTRPQRDTQTSAAKDLIAGLRFVARHRIVLGALSLDLFAVLLGGAVALLPVFARDVLHVGPSGLGLLRSAPALGATLVGVLLAHRPLERQVGRVLLACVFLFGCATIVFGLSRSYPLSLAALLIAGAADMISVVVRQTLVQLRTPDEMRGRVAAVNVLFVGASNELGEFESGLTAAWLGVVPAVVFGGAGTCLVVLIWLLLFPDLAKVDALDPESRPKPI